MNRRDDDDPRVADIEDRRDHGHPEDDDRASNAYDRWIYGDHL